MQATRPCSVDGCTKPAKAHGWCAMHYARVRRHGTPGGGEQLRAPGRVCSVGGCDAEHSGHGYCAVHLMRWKRHGDPLVDLIFRPKTCSVDGCERQAVARGWCLPHYKKWQRWGTPTPTPPTTDERFFSHVTEQPDGCWVWDHLTPGGYGTYFCPNGASSRVHPHRWVYEYMRAEIPPGLVIDHLCSNRACVNPWHLEPVTQQENVLRSYARAASASP